MPVFDFKHTSDEKKFQECTYTTFRSNETEATAEKPMLVLDNSNRKWKHHSCGIFTNPIKKTSFEFDEEDGTVSADILQIDARFVSLIKWLGENHINVRLSGENRADGYAVYKIREIAFGGATKLSAEDGFLQFMIERLFASSAPTEEAVDEEMEEDGDSMKLTSLHFVFVSSSEYHRLHELCRKNPSGQYPSVGKKKSCCCKITRSVTGRKKTCAESSFNHDEYSVEEQLF